MGEVNCIFCGWHRFRNTSKGAEPWDFDAMLRALIIHLDTVHFELWNQFLGFVQGVSSLSQPQRERVE